VVEIGKRFFFTATTTDFFELGWHKYYPLTVSSDIQTIYIAPAIYLNI
jgi:hypothetical protein